MPLNGEVLGQKFYAARNPKWTKLGKAGKPLMGLRANGQKPGHKGIANQGKIRKAFAKTAYDKLFGQYGKDERGMPVVADIMQAEFPKNLRKTEEQKLAERREAAAKLHARRGKSWGF